MTDASASYISTRPLIPLPAPLRGQQFLPVVARGTYDFDAPSRRGETRYFENLREFNFYAGLFPRA